MSLLKQAAVISGTVLVAGTVGYPLTLRLGGPAAVAALLVAAAGCLGAGLIALLPPVLVARVRQAWLIPQAALAGMVLRVLLTGAFMFVVTKAGVLPYKPFTTWLLIFYGVLLVVETSMVASYARLLSPPIKPPGVHRA